jgi:hypothetical protein
VRAEGMAGSATGYGERGSRRGVFGALAGGYRADPERESGANLGVGACGSARRVGQRGSLSKVVETAVEIGGGRRLRRSREPEKSWWLGALLRGRRR